MPPIYTSKDKGMGGLPLGGIGAGKMEILPNGQWDAFTFLNNWSNPLKGRAPGLGLLGYCLGVRAEGRSFLLQSEPFPNIHTVKQIRYEGIFPTVRLTFIQPGLGLELTLEAHSIFIPGDVKNSSLPACFFKLTARNLKKRPQELAFFFMGRNVSGDWCVGRQNHVQIKKDCLDLSLSNSDPTGRDPKQGELRFCFDTKSWKASYWESWNAVTKNFNFDPENMSMVAWEAFAKTGELSNRRDATKVTGENRELCAAASFAKTLGADGQAELSFMAAWHYPSHPEGHRYTLSFKDAQSVLVYGTQHRQVLTERTHRFQKLVFSLPLPTWFCDALLTSLAPFFSSSRFAEDGRFAFYEAPIVCPLLGTLDVGFYGSIPLAYFFPTLEKSQLGQFASAQRSDGYLPHDLGRNRLDTPSDGTTFYQWKDLNPKFILMVYRVYQWSKDKAFLKKMLPHVKAAVDWCARNDKDGNGLPDHEGADQTFDLWDMRGTQAYTAGLFLASLLACQKIALTLGDEKLLAWSRKLYLKGRFSFEKELWTGRFFGKGCALAQLNGQWAADLLGLGSIADDSKIHTALGTILKMNQGAFGRVNAVLADGGADTSNAHAKNVWLGMNFAFISLCIFRGFSTRILLKDAQKLWDNILYKQKSPWNLPDMVDSKNGRFLFGDSYYRNMAIWSIPMALASKDKKTASLLQKMREL